MQTSSYVLLFPCLNSIPPISYDFFKGGKCREYQLIYAQKAIVRRVILLSERKAVVFRSVTKYSIPWLISIKCCGFLCSLGLIEFNGKIGF
jgi:hypothetical protein